METQHWNTEKDYLTRTVQLNNFVEVVELINKITIPAEEMNHHPDLRVYDYKFLEIKLSSHSEGRVTEADHKLAERINLLVLG
jgi:4a-hydroxytetrahydrobiopterin dehydratase